MTGFLLAEQVWSGDSSDLPYERPNVRGRHLARRTVDADGGLVGLCGCAEQLN